MIIILVIVLLTRRRSRKGAQEKDEDPPLFPGGQRELSPVPPSQGYQASSSPGRYSGLMEDGEASERNLPPVRFSVASTSSTATKLRDMDARPVGEAVDP